MKKSLQQQIQELKEQGYEVEINHIRDVRVSLGETWNYKPRGDRILPRGGVTQVRILRDEQVLVADYAECSDKDNYCRRIGASITLGRAAKKLKREILKEQIKHPKYVFGDRINTERL